ncbi:MAG TPA: ABC transporter transmembrane domain-containing protein, partial [Steroidobacteraceae bacterium]|nr:ABC transporter transmembrane domain-containing protein [Steroidobacteraceae bacterium]
MSNERPKGSSLKPLRALLPFLAPYRDRMLVAFLALLVAAAAMLALPQALKNVIDKGFSAANAAAIDRYFMWLLVAAAVFAAFASLRMYLVNWIGERVVADLRSAVYARVIRMDPAFFEVTKTGEVLSRLTTDTTLIQSLSGIGLSILLRSTVSFVGSLVLLLLTSLKLALIIFALIPTVLLPMLLFGRRVRRLSRDSQDRVADTSGLAGETLNAIQTVQAFTLEGLHGRRYDDAVEASFTTAIQRTRVRAWLIALAIMTMFSAVTLVLWLGARSVLDGTMSGGDLAKFLSYAIFMGTSVAALSEMWGELQRASGAMERTIELLQSRPSIITPVEPIDLQVVKGGITFQHLNFNYPSRPDTRALDDFDLKIAPGETVAFVGPSGAGKSTVFQLLLRFYDPGSGRILIDGQDIARADPSAVRARIGLVPQETMIFGATARENIRYGRPGASDADIEAAARAAAADEFIGRLPDGYDTFLGEKGARLSGGQKQRIAIARAILKNPPILLLDEATSSLDSESEQLVRDALEKLMRDRTTLVIAHRLATAVNSNRIVVVDRGRIVGTGRHEELLRDNALYARLAALQFGERGDSPWP